MRIMNNSVILLISRIEELSGVVQVPAGAPASVGSGAGTLIRRLSACTRVPHGENKSKGTPPLFEVGIQTRCELTVSHL